MAAHLSHADGYSLGPAPTHKQSMIRVILMALYIYIMNTIQPLMSGGSIQGTAPTREQPWDRAGTKIPTDSRCYGKLES